MWLTSAGYKIDGMFMRNWDERDETGFCNADEDMADVQRICERLKIPFTEHNFVKEYWNDVFRYRYRLLMAIRSQRSGFFTATWWRGTSAD